MCEIKDFLIDHPGISVRWLEQQVSVPIGSIRIKRNKPIPEKYIQPLLAVLVKYGYLMNDVQTSDKPIVSIGKNYVTYKDKIGNWEGQEFHKLFFGAGLPDGFVIAI